MMLSNFNKENKRILKEITKALEEVDNQQIDLLIQQINEADKVFFIGVGRVLLSLESIAKRLAHLGVKAYIVGQVTEPAITDKDLLIVGSGSGETAFPLIIAEKAKKFNAKVVHIGANPDSSMKKYSDIFVRIPVATKLNRADEVSSIQPMTSLFEQSLLLLGDTIALMLIKQRSIHMKQLWQYHANLE